MTVFDKDIDITRNIKIIEYLKSELLTAVGEVYRTMANQTKDQINESISELLSTIILICYLLARRLGISYNSIEKGIEDKIKLGLIEQHDVEKYYKDLSELSKHLKK